MNSNNAAGECKQECAIVKRRFEFQQNIFDEVGWNGEDDTVYDVMYIYIITCVYNSIRKINFLWFFQFFKFSLQVDEKWLKFQSVGLSQKYSQQRGDDDFNFS